MDKLRKIEVKPGILFQNFRHNNYSYNPLYGEHPDYLEAVKIIRENRKNWTQEDYNKLLCSGSKEIKRKKNKIIENQIRLEF